MKLLILPLFAILSVALAKNTINEHLDVKIIVKACDKDGNQMLDEKETKECKKDYPAVKMIDLNRDGMVEHNEIKDKIKEHREKERIEASTKPPEKENMFTKGLPEVTPDKQRYLDDLQHYKDLVKDCDLDRKENPSRENIITKDEIETCTLHDETHKSMIAEFDENHDGALDRDEQRTIITRIRERHGVYSSGPTTPMTFDKKK